MIDTIGDRLDIIFQVWQKNALWMAWNLFLALIPLVLSIPLFGKPRSRGWRWGIVGLTAAMLFPHLDMAIAIGSRLLQYPLFWGMAIAVTFLSLWRRSRFLVWWLGFAVFVAFLPNAPYVLTDIIHFVRDVRQGYSTWIVAFVLIPQYFIFMAIGFQAYTLSLMALGETLRDRGWKKAIVPVELGLHFLCAIGIYLGRFQRWNTWDLVTQPDAVMAGMVSDLAQQFFPVAIAVTFITIAILYVLVKFVDRAVLLLLS